MPSTIGKFPFWTPRAFSRPSPLTLLPTLVSCFTLHSPHLSTNSHTIAPEISLYNARIVYQWNVRLNNGRLETQVDPTESVRVTWIDLSPNGKWVTRVRFPLSGTSRSALQADIQVQRQFTF
jgi:hypothetical protein